LNLFTNHDKKIDYHDIIPQAVSVLSMVRIFDDLDHFLASIGGRITAAIIAKFFISFSFSGVYLWSAELFPTAVR
jgi:hypothetical protein